MKNKYTFTDFNIEDIDMDEAILCSITLSERTINDEKKVLLDQFGERKKYYENKFLNIRKSERRDYLTEIEKLYSGVLEYFLKPNAQLSSEKIEELILEAVWYRILNKEHRKEDTQWLKLRQQEEQEYFENLKDEILGEIEDESITKWMEDNSFEIIDDDNSYWSNREFEERSHWVDKINKNDYSEYAPEVMNTYSKQVRNDIKKLKLNKLSQEAAKK